MFSGVLVWTEIRMFRKRLLFLGLSSLIYNFLKENISLEIKYCCHYYVLKFQNEWYNYVKYIV